MGLLKEQLLIHSICRWWWFVVRISPYTQGDRQVTGTVLTFTNVTAFRSSIDRAIYERECTKAILNAVAEPLVVLRKLIGDVYGWQRTMAREPRLHSLFLAGARAWPVPKPASTRQIRWPKQHAASLTLTSPVNPILKYNRRLSRSGAVSFYAVSPRKGRHRSSACISC
jgi:hypothetical protein